MSSLRGARHCALLLCFAAVILTFRILGQPSSLALSVNSNSIQLGQAVTLTATITPATASGIITFSDGVLVLGTSRISAGTATLVTRALPAGNQSLRAFFGGDGSNPAAASALVPVVVTAVHGFGLAATTSAGSGYKVVAADFNGDGITDFAMEDLTNPGFTVLLGNGDGTFRKAGSFGTYSLPTEQAGLVAADFNSDGIVDIAGAANSTGGIVVFLGSGDGTFQSPISYVNNNVYPNSLAVGDFNGDGKADLAISDGVSSVGVYLGNGDGTFQPIVTYTVGNDPYCVTVADFNGDNKQDLLVVNFQGNNISVLLGKGDGTFQPAMNYPTGNEPQAAVVGDFNGDGRADVATANRMDGTVSVLLGNGDGTFQAAVPYAVASNPGAVTVGDFNADGKPDLAVGNWADNTNTSISILISNGDGTFQVARNFPNNGAPYTLIAGDFNGDGRQDLAVGAQYGFGLQSGVGPPDLAVTSTHTGIFASGETGAQYTLTVTNWGPGWSDDVITVADALPSIMSATAIGGSGWNCTIASLSCSRSDGAAPGAAYPNITVTANVATVSPQNVTNSATVSAAAGDPNLANNTVNDATIVGLVQSITFAPIPNHTVLDAPFTVTATASSGLSVGFSAAGNCTVAGTTVTVTNLGSCSITASQSGNTIYGPGSLTRTFNIVAGVSSVILSTASQTSVQLGSPATLTATVSPSTVTAKVTFYDGAAVLGTVPLTSGVATLVTPLLSAGNHKLRAYCAGASSSAVSLTVNSLAGTFPAYNQPGVTGMASALALGDVNGDGIPDLAVADFRSNAVGILLGDGHGNFSTAVNYPAGGIPASIALADFNGDGFLDIVVANAAGASVLLGNGNGIFRSQVTYSLGSQGYSVVVSDFDGDGKPDFAVALPNSLVAVLLGNGDGTFRSAGAYPTNSRMSAQTTMALVAADFNGDGKSDLAVTDAANNAVSILLGNGDGSFQTAASVATGGAPQSLAKGDFNGDGIQDLVVGLSGQVAILLGNGTGGFSAPITQTPTPGTIYVAVGDFNGDGKLDVAAASSLNNVVTIMPGLGDGSLQPGTNVTLLGSPDSLLVADVNGDHKSDIIEGLTDRNNVNVSLSVGPAAQLVFPSQPGGAAVGTPMFPFNVQVTDRFSDVNTTSTAAVTVTSSPAGVSSTVSAVNGVATFSNLVFSTTGTYSLNATSPGLTSVTTNPFLVVAALPAVVIDTPAQGATLSSGTITISGWALDNLQSAGTAITSVNVSVDGMAAGTATYGLSRPDVCSVYPGRPGCPNVGYSDVLALPAGAHTLVVTATRSGYPAVSNSAGVTVVVQAAAIATKAAVFRNSSSFLEDSNGNGAYDPGVDRFISNFTGPGGFVAGDVPVSGDWTGDGHAKVGIYRPSTGQWFLDANNNGVFDAGDFTYAFGGLAGDMPFVGDWTASGKGCVGIYRSAGSVWLLDLNCNGAYEGTPTDAFFPFGGLSGDVPVVGAWTGGATRVGVVRKYAPGGVPQGNPFYWVLDAGDPVSGYLPANHPPDVARCFGFGGLGGDVFVTGDWYGTGTFTAGAYRAGFWVLDAAAPGAPQSSHVPGLTFGYGGVAGDLPLPGKW